jgi:hypothetical protein
MWIIYPDQGHRRSERIWLRSRRCRKQSGKRKSPVGGRLDHMTLRNRITAQPHRQGTPVTAAIAIVASIAATRMSSWAPVFRRCLAEIPSVISKPSPGDCPSKPDPLSRNLKSVRAWIAVARMSMCQCESDLVGFFLDLAAYVPISAVAGTCPSPRDLR